MSPTIPRPIESAPFAASTQPGETMWVRWDLADALGRGIGVHSERAWQRARVSRMRRVQSSGRSKAHHPDLSGLGHEFDADLYCGGCGREYLAVCAWKPKCEGGS